MLRDQAPVWASANRGLHCPGDAGSGMEVGSVPEGRAGAGRRRGTLGCGDARQRSCLSTPALETLCWAAAPAEAFESSEEIVSAAPKYVPS